MEDTAYEWESIKGMTNTAMLEREIAVLTKQLRRITKRLDYLHICKHQLDNSSLSDKVSPVETVEYQK